MHPLWPDVESHLPRLWRTVRAYEADPALQEDLMQEILVAAWRALPRLHDDARLLPFLLRIAHNLCASHVRGAVRAPVRVALHEAPELSATASDPADAAEAAWLQAALRELPLPQRQVLLLRLEGFDYGEIAELLGIGIDNVGVRLHRARRKLQELHDGPG